jgi:F0F1-type ATP synthase membrane subunit c/vacuolar-type H+-ATPase subunit K
MSLGIVIANIAGPVRQSAEAPAAAIAEGAAGAGSGIANATVSQHAPAIAASQPQLASSLTLVVLQLLNEQGVVTSTIPSAQQLAAYRAGTAVPPS